MARAVICVRFVATPNSKLAPMSLQSLTVMPLPNPNSLRSTPWIAHLLRITVRAHGQGQGARACGRRGEGHVRNSDHTHLFK